MAKAGKVLIGLGSGVIFASLVSVFYVGRLDLPGFIVAGAETGGAETESALETDAAAPANLAEAPANSGSAKPVAGGAGTTADAETMAALDPAIGGSDTAAEDQSGLTDTPASADGAEGRDDVLFDLVRIEPDGATLVAGSGPVGQALAILVDGTRIAMTEAGGDGRFVSFLDLPQDHRPRVMTLALLTEEDEIGEQGNQRIILAPSRAAPVATAPEAADTALETSPTPAAVPEAETEAPEQPAVAALDAAPAPESPSSNSSLPIASDAPGAPAVLLADDKGLRVLQPGGAAPEVTTEVALDVISYDAEGEVNLAGRAPAEGGVRIYLDNEPVVTTPVDDTGSWRVNLPQIDSGNYTLRVDQIAEDGSVSSRLETPFRRESQEVLDDAPRDASGAVTATVMPGSTLWEIAESKYGQGVMYVRVFDANRDKIRNPDLIYPGQIFDLPEE